MIINVLILHAMLVNCAPAISPITFKAVVEQESSRNVYAIGVVGKKLKWQPRNEPEAIATVAHLERLGYNYSIGLAQVNRVHLLRLNISVNKAFQTCANLALGASILQDCYARAPGSGDARLANSLSCYYTGSFRSQDGARYAKQVINRMFK